MEIFKIILVALITVVASVILKQLKPEMTIFVSIAGGIVIILMLVNSVSNVFDGFRSLMTKTGVNSSLFKSVLKVVGIGYITEFGASICKDAGVASIADKVMFAGKICILLLCMPIVNNLLEIIIGIMPWNIVIKG